MNRIFTFEFYESVENNIIIENVIGIRSYDNAVPVLKFEGPLIAFGKVKRIGKFDFINLGNGNGILPVLVEPIKIN